MHLWHPCVGRFWPSDYDEDDIRMVNHDIWMANHAVGLTRKGINSPASQVDTEKMKPNYSCGQPLDSQG